MHLPIAEHTRIRWALVFIFSHLVEDAALNSTLVEDKLAQKFTNKALLLPQPLVKNLALQNIT